MKNKKVYITREIPRKAVDLLKERYVVDMNMEDRELTKDEIIKNSLEADAVLCMLNDRIDKEVIDNCKNIKIFANYAVGFNNIDIVEAKKHNIVVTNTPDVLTNTTAELAWSLVFAVARRVVESDKYARDGKFKSWSPTLFLGLDITGKTLGIIGAGRIGRAFAKMSTGFNMNILYNNRKRDYDFEKTMNAKWVDKETLLKESDIISIHAPLTQETNHLIGEKELNLMKDTTILINTARGPVIDEKALVEALKNKKIFGAGLDVYEFEPEITEELKKLNNAVLLPHIGSATIDTRDNMALMAAQNIIAVLEGKNPITPVK